MSHHHTYTWGGGGYYLPHGWTRLAPPPRQTEIILHPLPPPDHHSLAFFGWRVCKMDLTHLFLLYKLEGHILSCFPANPKPIAALQEPCQIRFRWVSSSAIALYGQLHWQTTWPEGPALPALSVGHSTTSKRSGQQEEEDPWCTPTLILTPLVMLQTWSRCGLSQRQSGALPPTVLVWVLYHWPSPSPQTQHGSLLFPCLSFSVTGRKDQMTNRVLLPKIVFSYTSLHNYRDKTFRPFSNDWKEWKTICRRLGNRGQSSQSQKWWLALCCRLTGTSSSRFNYEEGGSESLRHPVIQKNNLGLPFCHSNLSS